MSGMDQALLLVALIGCAAILARAGDVRVWAVVAGACVVAVLIGAMG